MIDIFSVDGLNNLATSFTDKFKKVYSETESNVTRFFNPESGIKSFTGIKKFPKNLKDEKAFILIPYEFNPKNTNYYANVSYVENSNGGSIILPSPTNGLSINDNHNWGEAEGLGNTFWQQMLTNLQQGAKQIGAGAYEHLMESKFINDWSSLNYGGTNFRSFSFDWDIHFNSQEEAVQFFDIVTLIRKLSLPEYNASYVRYPYFWKLFPVKKDNKFKMYIKDSVITDFSINFAPDGVIQLHSSGHPVHCTLSISFKELFRASANDTGGNL